MTITATALFVIDTPSQVFNLQEALLAYNIEHYDVIICDCCRADAWLQLKQLLLRLTPLNLIEVPRVAGAIADRIGIYARHLPWLQAQSYSQVFFSNIRQQWQRDIVCSLPSAQVVLMDDGNATLVFYHYLFQQQQFFDFPADPDQHRAATAAQIRADYGICVTAPKQLELFTIFKLPQFPWLSVRQNLMSTVRQQHAQVDHQQVLILGIGAVELNYTTAESYIALLQQAQQLFPGRQVIYQPHRISSAALIEQIKQQTALEVIRLNEPVEDWLARHPCPPATIVSFFSMALSTISLCFPALQVISLDPGQQAWPGAKNSHVWNLTKCNNLDIINTIMAYLAQDAGVQVIPLTEG